MRLLEYATGQSARVLGKPSPEFFTAPLDALGRRPDTDVSGKGDHPRSGAEAEPDAFLDSIAELPGLLQR